MSFNCNVSEKKKPSARTLGFPELYESPVSAKTIDSYCSFIDKNKNK